jgi:Fic family protein
MKGTHTETHPWITFQLDTRKIPHSVWMDLGAIRSKIEHVANAMLPGNVAERLSVLYLSKGVHGTTAIEGNTLSEEEVRKCIEGRLKLPPSQQYQAKEVKNVALACNEIASAILGGLGAELSVQQICLYNKMVLDDLPTDEEVIPGQIRKHSVVVRGVGYRGVTPTQCKDLLQRMCDWLNRTVQPPTPDQQDAFAVLRAILAHLYIAWIHPFGDGNGRTARLIEFQMLLNAGFPSIAAHLLSNHYNITRSEYYRQLAQASRSGGNVVPFIRYAVQGLRDRLDAQIKEIRLLQWTLAWKDYVYSKFRDRKGDAAHRQRQLVLELTDRGPTPIARLTELSPQIARLYAHKTRKTLTRDVNCLLKEELVRRTKHGIESNHRSLLRFLPPRRLEELDKE